MGSFLPPRVSPFTNCIYRPMQQANRLTCKKPAKALELNHPALQQIGFWGYTQGCTKANARLYWAKRGGRNQVGV